MNSRILISRTFSSVISVATAIGIGALIVALLGKDPFSAIYLLFSGALANYYGLGHTINLTAVLILTGLATVIPFAAGVANVGTEGQLYIGGLGSVIAIFSLPN